MMLTSLRLSEDLQIWAQVGVAGLVFITAALLFIEARSLEKWRFFVFLSGLVATVALSLAVLRPTRLTTRGHEVPGMTTLLVDASHRLRMPSDDLERTRIARAEESIAEIRKSFDGARIDVRWFDAGLLPPGHEGTTASSSSDLLQALKEIASGQTQRPQSVVLLSDGRLTKPGPFEQGEFDARMRAAAGGLPVHAVALASKNPRDRSIREVGFTGSAVAHQPITLNLEVGCHPKETCAEVEVVVSELLEGQAPVELARGKTEGDEGSAKLELELILDRAGGRVVEVELLGEADEVPENNRRLLPVQVRRDRLRMLHVAGRPTYDVRALRMFLKSDESIDLISFFILRTPDDEVGARQDELALIPFPVDELFSEHLKSFDAIILQDIDASRYGLDAYFPSMKRYVREGGGLIMVGGPTGFSSGGYAGSELADVLPVELPVRGDLVTKRPFVPGYTDSGRNAPLLAGLRATMGEDLPEMSGANLLGGPLPGAIVLWHHPTLTEAGASGSSPMPVLALREVGDGRTIAISVDNTHELRFGEGGASTGGQAYADLWGGLLGWLMRDPRYEGVQMRLSGACVAGQDQALIVEPPPPEGTDVQVSLVRLGAAASAPQVLPQMANLASGAPRYLVESPDEGGYAARVQLGDAPPTRAVFACEAGGPAWSDSRPDGARLAAIAEATRGIAVRLEELDKLPPPQGTFVAARRESTPLLPPWVWGIVAALFLSVHWILRRAVGYA